MDNLRVDKLASGESANELVYDVEAAPDGKVWVVTSRSVAMFENEAWTIFQEGQGFNSSRFFNALALGAKGRPWTAHSNGVDVFENGEWQTIEKNDYNSPASLAVDAKGQVWFGTLNEPESGQEGFVPMHRRFFTPGHDAQIEADRKSLPEEFRNQLLNELKGGRG